MTFWVYILRCADGSYYTGHSDALDVRLAQHDQGAFRDCYTYKRRPLELVYSQDFEVRDDAFRAERKIKGWRRVKKEALIAHRFDLLPGLAKTARASFLPCVDSSTVLRRAQDERDLYAAHGEPVEPTAHGEPVEPRTSDRPDRPHPTEQHNTDLDWMRHALALADRAEREDDEIPVGAVLVGADGALLGEGWNRNISEYDPSAHAEIMAMRQAGRALGNHRLVGCTLYVTLEPCAMCAVAMVHARIARLVYAAGDPKTGAAGSVFDLVADPRHNHRIEVSSGVLAVEAGTRLSNYFRRKRGKAPL